jgi:hypothetical protein
MGPEIQLIIDTTLLSLGIAYAWWVRFRVWILREDLFSIRDKLWDRMRDEGALDDPDHRRVRDEINALIRIAPLFSLLTVFRFILEREKPVIDDMRNAREPIRAARDEVVNRLACYLLFHTLTGWSATAVVLVLAIVAGVRQPLRAAFEALATVVNKIFGSVQVRAESAHIEQLAARALLNI